MIRTAGNSLVALALFASGLTAQSTPSIASVAGCYTITLGEWSGPFPSGSADYHQPPATFRLDSTLRASRQGYYTVTSAPLTPAIRRLVPGWRLRGADTVSLHWSTGFAGVNLRLAVRGDTLRGTARAFQDVIGPTQPTANAVAIRISCNRIGL